MIFVSKQSYSGWAVKYQRQFKKGIWCQEKHIFGSTCVPNVQHLKENRDGRPREWRSCVSYLKARSSEVNGRQGGKWKGHLSWICLVSAFRICFWQWFSSDVEKLRGAVSGKWKTQRKWKEYSFLVFSGPDVSERAIFLAYNLWRQAKSCKRNGSFADNQHHTRFF